MPWAQAALFVLVGFFLALNTFFANPFATSSPAPNQGAGLDPLLRHTTMMIHPPMLYSGYTLMLIPFCFAIGALVSGRLSSEWISVTRRFALGAWLFLGFGILLGARWSYTELGWGWLLGLGPRRERRADAVAGGHRLHPLDHDSGEAGASEGVERLACATRRADGDGGGFPRALRGPLLDHAFVPDPTLDIAFVAIISVMAVGSFGLVLCAGRAAIDGDDRLDLLPGGRCSSPRTWCSSRSRS